MTDARSDREREVIQGAYVARDGTLRQIPSGRWRRLWMRLTARKVYW